MGQSKKTVFEVRAALSEMGRLESGPPPFGAGDATTAQADGCECGPMAGRLRQGSGIARQRQGSARQPRGAARLRARELRADEEATMPGLRAAISATEKRIEALREELEEALKAWRDAALRQTTLILYRNKKPGHSMVLPRIM